MNTQNLYDTDFNSWIHAHILLLKEGRFNEIDATHLIEELEDMGKSNKRELENRLEKLIMHLLKWNFQIEKRSSSWKGTVTEQRKKIDRLLKDSPSLKNKIEECIANIYADAVQLASEETEIAENNFPKECPYSQEELLFKKLEDF